jgi:hypothetical protein
MGVITYAWSTLYSKRRFSPSKDPMAHRKPCLKS